MSSCSKLQIQWNDDVQGRELAGCTDRTSRSRLGLRPHSPARNRAEQVSTYARVVLAQAHAEAAVRLRWGTGTGGTAKSGGDERCNQRIRPMRRVITRCYCCCMLHCSSGGRGEDGADLGEKGPGQENGVFFFFLTNYMLLCFAEMWARSWDGILRAKVYRRR